MSDQTLEAYLSLAALRADHAELLRRSRARGEGMETPEFRAAVRTFLARAQSTGTLLDSEDERWIAQSLLDYWVASLHRAGDEPITVTLDDFDPALAPELPDDLRPYVGLDAFSGDQAALFFGRQRLVEQLAEQLERQRLLAVVGPSGSGKSSVVRAGLLPLLRQGAIPGSETWQILPPMVPGSAPLAALERVLKQVGHGSAAPLVLVVDQFEEAFTLCTDADQRGAFIERLIGLFQDPQAAHRVILTMRSDFEPFVARAEALQPFFEAAKVSLPPMSAGELREVIERPAEQIGLKFEAGVVDALLQDVLGEPAALPLLQFTLLKLWEGRERNRLTMAAYKRIGGGRLALSRAADATYESLIPEEQVTARRLLLRMVRPGEGLEVTSNRVRRADLFLDGEDPGRVERVLQKLISARLVRETARDLEEDEQVEVAHEALVRNWTTLVGWLDDDRARLRQRQRLSAAAQEWQRLDRDPGALLRGTLLAEAERYDDLSEQERVFVEASRQALAREQEEELSRQRELARAEAQAEHQQQQIEFERRRALEHARSSRRFGILAAVLAVLFVLTVVILGYALFQRERAKQAQAEAEKQQQMATARQLSAQAITLAPENPSLATLLSLTSQQIGDVPDSRRALLTSLASIGPIERYLHGHRSVVESVAFAPDGLRLFSGGSDGTIIVWDIERSTPIGQPLTTGFGTVMRLAVSRDGSRLVSGHNGGVVLWDLATLEPIVELPHVNVFGAAFHPNDDLVAISSCIGSESDTCSSSQITFLDPRDGKTVLDPIRYDGQIWDLAYSPDGKQLAWSSDNNEAVIWDVQTKKLVHHLGSHTDIVYGLAYSPDGQRIATASRDGTLLFWNTATGNQVSRLLDNHDATVVDVVFHPLLPIIISISLDGTVIFWDAESYQPLHEPYPGAEGGIYSISISGDGRHLATGNANGSVTLWHADGQSQTTLAQPHIHQTGAENAVMAVSPDESRIAVGGQGREILIYDTGSRELSRSLPNVHENTVSALAFSPNGRNLASADEDGMIVLWDVTRNAAIGEPFGDQADPIRAVAFSPDGRVLASAGVGGAIHLWDVTNHSLLGEPLRGHEKDIWDLAFNPEGTILASAGSDTTVRLWNVAARRALGKPLRGHTDQVWALAFAPDGTLASAGRDHTVRYWDTRAGASLGVEEGIPNNGILELAFSADGAVLALGAFPHNIVLWDRERKAPLSTVLAGHTEAVFDLRFLHNGQELVSIATDGTLRYWDLAGEGRPAGIVVWAYDELRAMAVSRDGSQLITGSTFGSLVFYDKSGNVAHREHQAHRGSIDSLAVSPSSTIVASAGGDGVVRVWDLVSHSEVEELQFDNQAESASRYDRTVEAVAFSADGANLAAGRRDGLITIWETESWEQLITIQVLGPVYALAFSPTEPLLAIGTKLENESAVFFWHPEARLSNGYFYHNEAITALTFAPNGKTLASASNDDTVRTFDVERRELVGLPIRVGQSWVSSIAYSPDGEILAAGSGDGEMALWDARTGIPLMPATSIHQKAAQDLVFDPGGQLDLLTSGEDGYVFRWSLDRDTVRQKACAIVRRNMSWAEWSQYSLNQPYQTTCPDTPLYFHQLVKHADTLAQAGKRDEAAAAFAEATAVSTATTWPILNNQVCWYGSMNGFGEAVLPACERGVALAEGFLLAQLRDSRGVARALVGDLNGAREDFAYYLERLRQERSDEYERFGPKREQWISALERGTNPFTTEVLAELRNE